MSERKDDSLPSFKELALMWAVHLAAFGVLIWRGYLGDAGCFALFMASMVAFLSGARMERYRKLLVEKSQGSDGAY